MYIVKYRGTTVIGGSQVDDKDVNASRDLDDRRKLNCTLLHINDVIINMYSYLMIHLNSITIRTDKIFFKS